MPSHSIVPSRKKISRALGAALASLYVDELEAIKKGGQENYLNRKLRDYLCAYFPGWEVKCEQRKEGDRMKRNSSGRGVRPDIIIHKSGLLGPNIAIVEAKGYWNKTDRQLDTNKLKDYQVKQHYMYAFQVEYGPERGFFGLV